MRKNAKRIICLTLVLIMLFATGSCGIKKQTIEGIVENSAPTSVVTLIDYVGASESLKSRFETRIDRNNNRAICDYTAQRYFDPELDEIKFDENGMVVSERIVTEKASIYFDMVSKRMTKDGGETWATADASTMNFKFDVSPNAYKEYNLNEDGNEVTAIAAAENAKALFGWELNAKEGSDVTVVVKTNGEFLYELKLTYIAPEGATVVVSSTYAYSDDVVVDEVKSKS